MNSACWQWNCWPVQSNVDDSEVVGRAFLRESTVCNVQWLSVPGGLKLLWCYRGRSSGPQSRGTAAAPTKSATASQTRPRPQQPPTLRGPRRNCLRTRAISVQIQWLMWGPKLLWWIRTGPTVCKFSDWWWPVSSMVNQEEGYQCANSVTDLH